MNITAFCVGAFIGSLITFAAMCISYCIKSNDNEKELRQQLEEVSQKHYTECGQIAHYDDELKEAKRLVAQLKSKLCDSSEYCAYCDELDMSEHDHFTCKYKKKKIPAVCYWQVLTPAHFDDIPWTKNEV